MSDKAKYILLSGIALCVLIICVVLCTILPKSSVREVVLVNDVETGNDRLIANKSDGLKGAEVKKFTYKPDIPEGYKTPEEAIPEEPIEVLPNDKGIVSVELDAREAKPLELVDPVKVFHKSSQDEKKARPKANVTTKDVSELKEELLKTIENRNIGRRKVREGISLFSTLGANEGELNTVTKKGAIIFPFEIANGKSRFEYIAQFKDLYEKYKEEVNFVFLNTTIDKADSVMEIKEIFELYSIPDEYVIYYDNYKSLFTEFRDFDGASGYVILNNDGYICHISKMSDGIVGLENKIIDLQSEVRKANAENETIIRNYCDRKGLNFTEIVKLNLGVNLDY